ncbi:MAG: HEAT repeat domain-containing protein [Planctomycetota bacterium]
MFKRKTAFAIMAVALCSVNACFAQTVKDNFDEFLHYTVIGRLDLAKGYAQALLASNPNPEELLDLSKENPQGYQILLRAKESATDAELADLSSQILALIEKGRFIRRSAPGIIAEEVRRLSSTERGWFAAVKRLRNAGEYAIPFMLDAMADSSREDELPYIVRALPEIGRGAIRPLAAALQTENVTVKAEIITALGKIAYPQAQAYLKYIVENDSSSQLRAAAQEALRQIDPDTLQVPAAQLFYDLAEKYYYHAQSLTPTEDVNFANVWFWNPAAGKLAREQVDQSYFNELMAMRCCEWALKADAGFGSAIGLWIAAFFKSESVGVAAMPAYFGDRHADALVYATTAGVEYLHQALARAVNIGHHRRREITALSIGPVAAGAPGPDVQRQNGPLQCRDSDRRCRPDRGIRREQAGHCEPRRSFGPDRPARNRRQWLERRNRRQLRPARRRGNAQISSEPESGHRPVRRPNRLGKGRERQPV